MDDAVTIWEVGLRDGLQNEKAVLTTHQKLALAGDLVGAGLRHLELASFVSPKAMPHMADAPKLMEAALRAWPRVRLSALVLTEVGYERALRAGTRAVAAVVIASETLSRRNSRMSVAESLGVCARILSRARVDGVWTRVYLSAAWGCPYEGPVDPGRVLSLADRIWAWGPDELAVADSAGRAVPSEVGGLAEDLCRRFDPSRLAAHLHDAGGAGLSSAAAAIAAGIRTLDASIGGLGGCPYAGGTAGNLDTRSLVSLVHGMGLRTGVRADALEPIAARVNALLGRPGAP